MKNSVRTLFTGAAIVVVASALVACGSDDTQPEAADAATEAVQETKSPAQISVPPGESTPEALSDGECKATGDKWTLTGTLTNKGKEAVTYSVRANVTKAAGGGLEGYELKDFTLEPGAEEKIEIKDFVTADPQGLTCTYSVRANKA